MTQSPDLEPQIIHEAEPFLNDLYSADDLAIPAQEAADEAASNPEDAPAQEAPDEAASIPQATETPWFTSFDWEEDLQVPGVIKAIPPEILIQKLPPEVLETLPSIQSMPQAKDFDSPEEWLAATQLTQTSNAQIVEKYTAAWNRAQYVVSMANSLYPDLHTEALGMQEPPVEVATTLLNLPHAPHLFHFLATNRELYTKILKLPVEQAQMTLQRLDVQMEMIDRQNHAAKKTPQTPVPPSPVIPPSAKAPVKTTPSAMRNSDPTGATPVRLDETFTDPGMRDYIRNKT